MAFLLGKKNLEQGSPEWMNPSPPPPKRTVGPLKDRERIAAHSRE